MNLLAAVQDIVRDEDARRTVSWGDIVLHVNRAPIPSPRADDPASVWNLGFDFLVLDAAGAASHFGRCRAAADVRQVRASEFRSTLSAEPDLVGIVPATRFRITGPLLVELSPFVRGTSFTTRIEADSSADFQADAKRIVHGTRRITTRAQELLPALQSGPATVDAAKAVSGALPLLVAAGLSAERCAALERALRAGTSLPRRVQHGDLWPANVLWHEDKVVVLDYEGLGEISVPLFDALHFLRSCLVVRHGSRTLVAVLEEGSPDAGVVQGILREEAAVDGLKGEAILAAAAFYLIEMTARVLSRDTATAYWQPYMHCLEALADRLSSPDRLTSVLVGPTG
jgi:hypothetical protein